MSAVPVFGVRYGCPAAETLVGLLVGHGILSTARAGSGIHSRVPFGFEVPPAARYSCPACAPALTAASAPAALAQMAEQRTRNA